MTKNNLLVSSNLLCIKSIDQIEITETTQKHTLDINHIYRRNTSSILQNSQKMIEHKMESIKSKEPTSKKSTKLHK